MNKNPTEGNTARTDLSIRNESVQRIFNFYKSDLLYVNRRYQRKLIWTIEEKERFIDSLVKGLPVPLILLAETISRGQTKFEIIDGMQRLNAITSFIEGEYSFNGEFFDLNTLVESKSLLDSGELSQKTPVLSRQVCERLSSYVLALSVYSFTDPQKVDEIFIRINSYGRHLSRQELRAAGTLESFGDLVRRVSSEVRTDVSHADILGLRQMKEISITNVGLNYGVNVDEIFWVSNYIITKDMVRESRDEEIVADLLSAIALPDVPSTSSAILDEYYGLVKSDRSDALDLALKKISPIVLREQFLSVYNELRKILSLSGKNFRDLLFQNNSQRIPRYFQIVFLALHQLLVKENKEVTGYPELIKKLTGLANQINITEGGNWSASNRMNNVTAIAGVLRSCFKDKKDDPGAHKWLTQFESLLMQSKTEQTSYDFKTGFTYLDDAKKFDDESFDKIILTLTAIANSSPKNIGYVCVGVTDKKKDADRVTKIYGVSSARYRPFYIVGIGHETTSIAKDLDDFYRQLIQRIKKQPIPNEAMDYISKNIRLINYFGKDVVVFKIESQKSPIFYDKKYYVRYGASVEEVPVERYSDFFNSYT